MKKMYTEVIEFHKAWRPRNKCRLCGSRDYEIHHLMETEDEEERWYCKCSDCGHMTVDTAFRETALALWRRR